MLYCSLIKFTGHILMVPLYEFIFFTVFSIAEPHHFYVAPALGENFDAAPAPAVPAVPASAPALYV
jgi:hypothetical protein